MIWKELINLVEELMGKVSKLGSDAAAEDVSGIMLIRIGQVMLYTVL